MAGGCGGNARPAIRVGVPDGDLELGADQSPAGRIEVEFVGRVPEVRMAPEGVQEELAAFLDVRVRREGHLEGPEVETRGDGQRSARHRRGPSVVADGEVPVRATSSDLLRGSHAAVLGRNPALHPIGVRHRCARVAG